jgi:hypothetical protein
VPPVAKTFKPAEKSLNLGFFSFMLVSDIKDFAIEVTAISRYPPY